MFAFAVFATVAALAAQPAARPHTSQDADGTLAAVYSQAADLFVSPSGSDEGPCTSSAPCRSFDRAYQIARPGDVVEAAGGSYPSQTLTAKRGARSPYVVIREAAGQRAVVGGRGETINCIGFAGASHVLVAGFETPYVDVQGDPSQCGVGVGREGTHHVTLLDLDVGGVWVGADDVQVLDSDIGPNVNEGGTPTAVSGDDEDDSERVLFQGNEFHDYTSVDGNHQQCFAAWSGQRVTVRDNRFSNCETFHLWLVAERGQTISRYVIEGNTFRQPDPSIGISATIKVGDHGGALENVLLRDNKVLIGGIYVVQGYDEGGTGDIRLLDNGTRRGISLGSRENCLTDATYDEADVVYECRGNILVGAVLHPPPE